ncbi:MAG TPA: type II secretion system F family protein, partial [Archangium sp.]
MAARENRPLNKPPLPRAEPPSSAAVRTARRPVPQGEAKTWLASAWARHPLVALVRHRPRLTFFLGLHSMIRAGVALPIAFSELSRGAAKDPFRRAVAQVGEAVAAGSGLAEAMRRQPMWFEPQVVELLGAAEASGTLESALARVTEQLQEAQRMRWRAVSLCAYPAYLLGAFIFGGALLDTTGVLMGSGGSGDILGLLVSHLLRNLLGVSSFGLALFLAPLVLASPALEPRWDVLRMR